MQKYVRVVSDGGLKSITERAASIFFSPDKLCQCLHVKRRFGTFTRLGTTINVYVVTSVAERGYTCGGVCSSWLGAKRDMATEVVTALNTEAPASQYGSGSKITSTLPHHEADARLETATGSDKTDAFKKVLQTRRSTTREASTATDN
ncbi:hypothetical protein E2C01_082531 [Portunus trituberculatus]|uniref:Uncharacterized protein n=1 Tax=Portunus trituberculatus TaxID=210409 RepID=A0A5B7IZD4_PORTR|nr:hypothetical protein [Portunus trituberculatus]